ncbi:hypothetical protein AAJ76_1000059970 [Vairimorpha ceranae]|uniref:Uncharacterized protein n=1 Tax=Vairimorpha ceranae TaxID=40302 RepID=A0A0F9WSS6_9MICR|nr:hypothetical protein AAJ76_1000059970 [Vairimorpha ceranae]KKO75888.1 hypothetical protein AAJ76_1000059970 [Vairimorpha ceranae]
MSKKDLLKFIEKELNSKTQKQIKQVQDQFEKSYTDIKKYIENKFNYESDILKSEIQKLKDIDVTQIINELRQQITIVIEKCNRISENVKNVNKKVLQIKRLRIDVKNAILQKLEEDTEQIKKKFIK